MVDILMRVSVVYFFLMATLRIMGKRELGVLSPFELVVVLLIPEIASGALIGQASLSQALLGISTLFLLVFATSAVAHRFRKFGALVESPPTVLVRQGKLCERAMNRERIQPEELFAEMHKSGYEDLAKIRWAILEGDGEIAFIPESDPEGVPAPHSSLAQRAT